MTHKTTNAEAVEIDAEAVVAEMSGGQSDQEVAQATQEAKKQVLVVDNDRILCTLMARGLQSAGLRVTTADTGAAAMKVISDTKPDAIVIDLMIPVVGGLSFLRWLRNEAKLDVPVVVFSTHTSSENQKKAIDAGATKVIAKTSDLSEFVRHMQSVLM